MTKTPFEVRLDVVKIAQEMLNKKLDIEQSNFTIATNNMGTTNIGGVQSFIESAAPKMYTEKDVVETASVLYAFVNNRETSKN